MCAGSSPVILEQTERGGIVCCPPRFFFDWEDFPVYLSIMQIWPFCVILCYLYLMYHAEIASPAG